MGIVIGIDVGGSTTKIVGINHDEVIQPMLVRATDPVASLFGALGKYMYNNGLSLKDIEHVVLTGAGSAFVQQPLYDLPTSKTDEFISNGLGARYHSSLDNLMVVSMGTGTSFVQVKGDEIKHVGGLGIGGGTINGLSKLLLNTNNFEQIKALAEKGDLNNVDLHIRDITPFPLPGLALDLTASLFGKADSDASKEDLALGIINMVLQTIAQGAVFTCMNSEIKDIVMIGNLTRLPHSKKVFSRIADLCKVRFFVPDYAEYRTAIGAALSYVSHWEKE